MQYFLQPNLSKPFNGSNNYTGQTIANIDDHQGFVRVDYNIDSTNRLFVRYGIENITGFAQPINTNNNSPTSCWNLPRRRRN